MLQQMKTLADVVKLINSPIQKQKIVFVPKKIPFLLQGKHNENNVLHKVQHS